MDDRDARGLLALAEHVGARRGTEADQDVAQLRGRMGEIEPAARVLLRSAPVDALRLVATLAGFWQDEGRVGDGRAVTRLVLEGASSARRLADAEAAHDIDRWRGRALTAASELAFRQGDQAEAAAAAREAIDAATRSSDAAGAATAWLMLARVAYRDGDAATIEATSRTALDLAGDDPTARRGALHMLAWAAHTAGDVEEARRRFHASLEYRREIGAGPLSEAVELGNLAELDLDAGMLRNAASGLREVLELARRLDNRYLAVNTVPAVAALAAAAGDHEEAARLFGVTAGLERATGLTPDPGCDRAEARREVEALLGPARFAVLHREGQAMTVDMGVARAIDVSLRVAASWPASG
jgi:ATP/maltotriose-dependent transcriptional regulator MalT